MRDYPVSYNINLNDVIGFLKQNLRIETQHTIGSFGEGSYTTIKLILCGEVISYDYIDD